MTANEGLRRRIVVVDEDVTTRALLQQQLQSVEFDVIPGSSLSDLIGRLPEYVPDVILVNTGDQTARCLEMCTKIKASQAFQHIPIILIVPDAFAIDSETLSAGSFDEILIGSISQPELLARVRSMLRIRQQYDELERTIEMRMALSYMIVHDVRNPLAAISLYMQLLKRKAQLQPDQVKYLDLALSEAQKMSSFLDDMLMLAKMERGKLSLSHSPLSVDRICNSVREKMAPLAESQNIRLHVHSTAQLQPLMADVTLFQRMLENLVAVALKRSPAQGVVTIGVSYPQAAGSHSNARAPLLRLCVSDQGEPIPVENLDRIFDQLEAVRLKEKGKSDLGLELAFCRMVVDAHGGEIIATNNHDVGVTITVEIFNDTV